LRIDQLGFQRRDIEKQWIELINAIDKAAPLTVVDTALATVVTVVLAPIPALRRNFADAVFASAQVLPEGFQIGGLRVAAGQADDGDRAALAGLLRRRVGRPLEPPVRPALRARP